MPHPLIELGGAGPPLILLPANGFPPATYVPALAPLFARYRVASLPPRAMWDDAGAAPATPGSWATLAEDALAGMERHGLAPAFVVGHSFGGVAGLLAARRRPDWVRGLALLDPTILPPALLEQFAAERARGEAMTRPLVQNALTRRDRFASVAEAFRYWRSKPLFADWSDAALERYARAMLRPAAGAPGLELTWARDWEAHYYASIYTEPWQELPRLEPRIPVLLVRGERSDTFLPEAAALAGTLLPRSVQRVIPGRGHLFPQTAPEETAAVLAEWLASFRPAA